MIAIIPNPLEIVTKFENATGGLKCSVKDFRACSARGYAAALWTSCGNVDYALLRVPVARG